MKKAITFLAVMALAVTILVSNFSLHTVKADAHVARIVAQANLTGQTTDVATVASITVPTGGANYRVTVSDVSTTAGTIGGEVVVSYTSDLTSFNTSMPFTGPWPLHAPMEFHAVGGTSVSIATMDSQTGGAQTYNLYVTIEEL